MACFDQVHDALAGLSDDARDVDSADRMLFETALVEIIATSWSTPAPPTASP